MNYQNFQNGDFPPKILFSCSELLQFLRFVVELVESIGLIKLDKHMNVDS